MSYTPIPTVLSPLAIRRALGRDRVAPPVPFGPQGWCFDRRHPHDPRVIVTVSDLPDDPTEWIHASISYPTRMPDYADLVMLRDAVFGNGWAYQVFAPPAAHVNLHEYALHLWGRADGAAALPDFGAAFGSI